MLFSDMTNSDIRDKLILLIEASAYCLSVLGNKDVLQDEQIGMAYTELAEAMGAIISADIAGHSEYDYILYRARLKLKQLTHEQTNCTLKSRRQQYKK